MTAAPDRDSCGCVSGGRHACGLPGIAVGPKLDALRVSDAASRSLELRHLLVVWAVVAFAVGIFGAVYNARDGMIFGTLAWLVLGALIAALCLLGARE